MVGGSNMEVPTSCQQVPKTKATHYLHHYCIFAGGGVSKLTINCSLIFSLFHPLIQFLCEKRLNDQINWTNNGAINGMFERPY